MIVDLISKVSLDEGSIPSSSTMLKVCKSKAVRFVEQTRLLSLGLTGFDSLQVWVKEIMVATKWQINQHVSAAFKEGRVNRSPGCVIPGFFNFC